MQKLTDLLRENEYVILVSVDFTKAFDSVKHMPLMQKMNLLDLPDSIIQLLMPLF